MTTGCSNDELSLNMNFFLKDTFETIWRPSHRL